MAALLAALTGHVAVSAWIMGPLALDFLVRAFVKPKYSPLATAVRSVVSGFHLPEKLVDGVAKAFTARIGVLFTVVSFAFYAVGFGAAGVAVTAVLLVCAGLKAFLGFCLGCWMYALLQRKAGKVNKQRR